MPEGVVQRLEVVEIGECDDEGLAPLRQMLRLGLEGPAIRQSRERVGARLFLGRGQHAEHAQPFAGLPPRRVAVRR